MVKDVLEQHFTDCEIMDKYVSGFPTSPVDTHLQDMLHVQQPVYVSSYASSP